MDGRVAPALLVDPLRAACGVGVMGLDLMVKRLESVPERCLVDLLGAACGSGVKVWCLRVQGLCLGVEGWGFRVGG